jgi:hypothetical protein
LTAFCDPTFSWVAKIPLIVPRIPHAQSIGDASFLGGGAHCEKMQFWFDLIWSPQIKKAIADKLVHINSLEFIVVIVQFAAMITRFAEMTLEQQQVWFPNGRPKFPVGHCLTDNWTSMSWARRVTSKSLQGQHLIGIFAELLRLFDVGLNADHLPGEDNDLADFISRPTDLNISPFERCEQIFRKHSSMRNWNYFRPSPELLQLLSSYLLAKRWPGPPKMPKTLGQFDPAGSTASCLCMI